ncbi:hypothetical protein SH16_00998 [Aeromonas caviae]|uniref:DUF4062 domain-containing protein n=1 Tax=Aeromonas caviae TaxID=648 RepID=UPI00065A01CC|nr:DUF4062 domain-containing protein [Aeromonas caviae]KLV47271.1 hypothetical protein SH16_00998 [Aeromonas caviae]
MAVPKVFVSSTCFDLSEIREQLSRFISNYGFESVLSEHGDVFYHPDLHTHEACVNEISNCQLFILIIGGRFGGQYVSDKSKSITNAEYDAAKRNNVPIFTYVRNSVLNNHHIFQQNKNKEFVTEIQYPAIDKQKHAVDIFNFVEQVRKSPLNNALEGFDNFSDIEISLRKQWAGMFFDFLKTREVKSQIDATNHYLSVLNSSSSKLELLVKSLYRSIDKENAETNISSIEVENSAKDFYAETIFFDMNFPDANSYLDYDIDIKKIARVSPENKSWDQYLAELGLFEYDTYIDEDGEHTVIERIGLGYGFILGDEHHKDKSKAFEFGVLRTTEQQRIDILNNLISTPK